MKKRVVFAIFFTFDEVVKSFYSSDSHDWLNEQVTVVVEMY